jgi:tetratricopeptide (TPR) repeat protein
MGLPPGKDIDVRLSSCLRAFVAALFLTGPAGAFTFSEGRRAYEKGDYPRAEEHFRKKAECSPGDAEASYSLGGSLYRQGKYEQAGEAYEKVVGKGKELQAGWYNLGNSYFRQDRFKDALQAYERALELDPEDKDARHNLELVKRRMKEGSRKDKSRPKDQGPRKEEPKDPGEGGKSPQEGDGKKEGNRADKKKEGKDGDGAPGQDPAQERAKGDQQRQADRQRRERAKKELGLNDKQVQDLLDQMQRWEASTQRYFSKDPRREREKRGNPWGHLPPQQQEFLKKFFGEKMPEEKGVPEDW